MDQRWGVGVSGSSVERGNLTVFARCESRYATSVFSPLAVVTLDLTA
jgi:hypothetical protein